MSMHFEDPFYCTISSMEKEDCLKSAVNKPGANCLENVSVNVREMDLKITL